MSEYRKKQMRKVHDQIRSSGCFLCLFDEKMWEDPHPCLELGMAIMLDKPIYILAPEGVPIPENLRRVSRKIEVYKSMEDAKFATERLIADLKQDPS